VPDLIPIFISAIALGLSVYGVFERRWTTFSAIRVRIAGLLAQIGDLNVEEASYVDETTDTDGSDEAPRRWYARSYIGQKRTLLAYQGVALITRLRHQQRGLGGSALRLTASELAALAYALGQCGDSRAARTYWNEAITTDQGVTDTVIADIHEGFATFLFSTSEFDRGREHYRAALEQYPHDTPGRSRGLPSLPDVA
jgi:tetratricopeptide (TPR) repeat protein